MTADITPLHPHSAGVGRDLLDVRDELNKQRQIIIGLECAFRALTKNSGSGLIGLCWVLQDVGDKLQDMSNDLERISNTAA